MLLCFGFFCIVCDYNIVDGILAGSGPLAPRHIYTDILGSVGPCLCRWRLTFRQFSCCPAIQFSPLFSTHFPATQFCLPDPRGCFVGHFCLLVVTLVLCQFQATTLRHFLRLVVLSRSPATCPIVIDYLFFI